MATTEAKIPAPKRTAKAAAPAAVKVEAKPVATPKIETPVAAPFVNDEAAGRPAAAVKAKPVVKSVPKRVAKPAKPTPRTVAKPAPAIIKEVVKMTDTVKQVEETFKKATAEAGEKATEFFKDAQTRAKAAFEKSGEVAKDVLEFHKANLEAVVESGKIAAKGAQTAAQNAADYGKKNWEATTAFAKSAAAVKAPTDFFKLQGDFARSQFDAAVAEFSKSSEFYLKLAGEVAQPLQNRFSAANEQIKSRFAA